MLFEDSQFETTAAAEASAVKLDVKKARHEHKSMEDIKELIILQNTSISEVMKMTMVATQALPQLAAIMMHTAVKPEGMTQSQPVPAGNAAWPIVEIGNAMAGNMAQGAALPQQGPKHRSTKDTKTYSRTHHQRHRQIKLKV